MPKKVEEKDSMVALTEGIENQIRLIRMDKMGEFQNKVVELVNESGLMAQEMFFVLDVVKENVRGNFLQVIAERERMKESKEEVKGK